jgi:hypothetical protein
VHTDVAAMITIVDPGVPLRRSGAEMEVASPRDTPHA